MTAGKDGIYTDGFLKEGFGGSIPPPSARKAILFEGGGENMGLNQGDTYAGKIKNSGSQCVEAIYAAHSKAKGKVTKGDDLRGGK